MALQLHEFIRETLTEVLRGISEAQDVASKQHPTAAIAPVGQGMRDDETLNQIVKFDVAVTTKAGTETKGGIGIIVGPITLGSAGKSDHRDDATNRISFSVPIFLPSQRINR